MNRCFATAIAGSLAVHTAAGLLIFGGGQSRPCLEFSPELEGVDTWLIAGSAATMAYEAPADVLVEIGIQAAPMVEQAEAPDVAVHDLRALQTSIDDRTNDLQKLLDDVRLALRDAQTAPREAPATGLTGAGPGPELPSERTQPSVTPGSAPAAASPPAEATRPTTPGDAGRSTGPAPRSTNRPPLYPQQARQRGQSGTVLVHLQIDAGGATITATLASSSGVAALDEAGLQAARGWRFAPATIGGKAVPSEVTIPIVFVLSR